MSPIRNGFDYLRLLHMTDFTLNEKNLKKRLNNGRGHELSLLMTWDNKSQVFYLSAVGNKVCFKILTTKGAHKFFKDPVLAIGWAKGIGLAGVQLEPITL